MERSAIRGELHRPIPHYASLHAGYLLLNLDRVTASNRSYRSPDGAQRNPGRASPPHPALRFAPCGLLAAYPAVMSIGSTNVRCCGADGRWRPYRAVEFRSRTARRAQRRRLGCGFLLRVSLGLGLLRRVLAARA